LTHKGKTLTFRLFEGIKPLLPKINDLIRDIEELIDEEDGI
jgi:hypothetical protein